MGSAGGGYTKQALAMGYNDKQADLFGAIMGSMEGATEAVGGALTANVGKKFASKGIQAGLGALGLDVTENFLEEAIMEPIQELTKQSIGKNGDWKDITKRMLQSGVDGALTSIIMGGASAGIGSAVKIATKAQNNEAITQEEIKQALQDINKSEEVDIEKLLVDSFNFQAQDLMQVTEAQQRKDDRLEKVAQDISQGEGLKIKYANLDDDRISQIENSKLSENQINNLLKIADKYDLSQKDIQDLIDNTKNGKYEQNQATTTPNNEILNQEQQTIQEDGKQVQNELSEQQEENKQTDIKNEQNMQVQDKNSQETLLKDNQGRIIKKELSNQLNETKVRDNSGNILEVYHGSLNKDFNTFDKNKIGKTTDSGMLGRGFYFTDNKNYADTYSNGNIQNTKKVYLNIKNPYIIDSQKTLDEFNRMYLKDTETQMKYLEKYGENYFNKFLDESTEELKQKGYDGVILKPFGNFKDTEYVVFNSSQIFDATQQPVEQTVNYTEKEPVLKYNISNTIETKNKKQTDERVAEILTEPLTQQKPENRKWAILNANIFDKGIVLENLSKKAKNRELEAKWDFSLLSESRAQNAIGNTRYEFEDGKKKQVSRALLDIKEDVGNKTADFQNYMYHLLNIDRMTLQDRFGIENKPVYRKQYRCKLFKK